MTINTGFRGFLLGCILVTALVVVGWQHRFTYKVLEPGQITVEKGGVPTIDTWMQGTQPVQVLSYEEYEENGSPLTSIRNNLSWTGLAYVAMVLSRIGPRNAFTNMVDNIESITRLGGSS